MNNNITSKPLIDKKPPHKNYLAEIAKKYKEKLTGINYKVLSSQNSGILSMKGENSYQSLEHSVVSNVINKSHNSSVSLGNKNININSEVAFAKKATELFNSEEHIKKFNEYKNLLDKKIEILKQKMSLHMNNKKIKLSINKLASINMINIKTNPFIIFLQMFNTNDLYILLSLNKEIKQMILSALAFEIKTFIANKFYDLSNLIFSNYSFLLGINKTLDENEYKSELILIIKTQITSTSLLKKSVHMRYSANFPCDGSEYVLNNFVFDIKNGELYFWIMKEYTTFHQDHLNKAYLQHIMQFNLNDYAEFTVNIITNKGLMNIRKFRWHPIKLFPTPSMNFYEYSNENSTKRELVDFNMSRYCELELLKGSWNDIELMEHSHIVKEKLYEIFQNSFIINKILFDDVGYYIFKIYLEAKQLGELRCDKAQIGIKIFIYDKKDVVSNEVKKNNLIYDRKNELQMHIGDKLVFYLSKDK